MNEESETQKYIHLLKEQIRVNPCPHWLQGPLTRAHQPQLTCWPWLYSTNMLVMATLSRGKLRALCTNIWTTAGVGKQQVVMWRRKQRLHVRLQRPRGTNATKILKRLGDALSSENLRTLPGNHRPHTAGVILMWKHVKLLECLPVPELWLYDCIINTDTWNLVYWATSLVEPCGWGPLPGSHYHPVVLSSPWLGAEEKGILNL